MYFQKKVGDPNILHKVNLIISEILLFYYSLIGINQLFVERYIVGLILWFCTCCGCKLVCKIETLCKLLKIWFQNFSKIARYRIDRWYLTTLVIDWLIWSKAIGIITKLFKLMTVLWILIDLKWWEVRCRWKRSQWRLWLPREDQITC